MIHSNFVCLNKIGDIYICRAVVKVRRVEYPFEFTRLHQNSHRITLSSQYERALALGHQTQI